MLIVILFYLLLSLATLFNKAPLAILFYYLLIGLLTFIFFALDKSAAKKAKWRTSENTLHFLGFIGGWTGSLLAQRFLRHKTKKQPFKAILWMTLFLNLTFLVWLIYTQSYLQVISLLENIIN